MNLHKNSFPGLLGPFQPEEIDLLDKLKRMVARNLSSVKSLIRNMDGFEETSPYSPTYSYGMIKFSFGEDKIIFVIPWGYKFDPHGKLTIYHSENAKEKSIEVVKKMTDIYWDEYFRRKPYFDEKEIPTSILSRDLPDGKKLIPEWYVEVRAFIHSTGCQFTSWLQAEKWFTDQGYVVA